MAAGTFERIHLESLLDLEASPHLTITLGTHRSGRESVQGASTLHRLLEDARRQLAAAGIEEIAVDRLLAPIAELVADTGFWQHQEEGLVVFARNGMACWYRLPYPVEEAVHLGGRFSVWPLLPLLSRTDAFYVLALSINQVRLVEARPDGARRVELRGLPASMEDALGIDQYYSEISVHAGGPAALGKRAGVRHGHGDADEERLETDLLAYFRRVADVMREELPAEVPWVLAAIARYLPIFREAARDDRRLLTAAVVGNPELSSDEELVARARPLLQPADAGERRRALDRFESQAGTARTTNELQTIVAAAHEGRVDALFVGDAPHPFGTFQPDLGRMEVHPAPEAGDEDLVDAAIFHTLRTGGHVFAMEDASLPLGGGLAAVLRY